MGKLFDKACEYAINKHHGQLRKDGSIYILHPFEVATIASSMTMDEEVLAAAILHDVVEDTDSSVDELTSLFGDNITNYVIFETEPKYPNISKTDSWKLRKENSIKKLRETKNINSKILYLSDKLANARSLYREYLVLGDKVFEKFNVKDKSIQAWYYYNVLDCLKELNNTDAYKEFQNKIDVIFEGVKLG